MKHFLKFTLVIVALSAGPAVAQQIPSCIEFAESQIYRGASPDCAPLKLSNADAFEVLDLLNVKKSGYSYFVTLTKPEWNVLDYKDIWEMLSLMVSAIQSLYSTNSDVYFVAGMTGLPILLSDLPQDRIVARAIYTRRPISLNSKEVFPPDHHKRLYTLIVYR